MEATVAVMNEIDLMKDFSGTIFESISKIGNRDIGDARKGLVDLDRKFPGEIFVGKLNPVEIKVIAYISKLRKKLDLELHKSNNLSGEEQSKSIKLANKLSRDITFAKLLLRYLVKNRFDLPSDMDIEFRKDFQVTIRREEHHYGEEDE